MRLLKIERPDIESYNAGQNDRMSEIKRMAAHIYRADIKDGRRRPRTKEGKMKLYEGHLGWSVRFMVERQAVEMRQTEPSDT